jgi:two-component system sensor kinase FixL
MFESFFLFHEAPAAVETGTYQFSLVVLSYLVASFASYTALVLAQHVVGARSISERRFSHWGGAFAMGAGIWSMHFVGMLSFKMRMLIVYDPLVTLLSLVIAIGVAFWALEMVARDRLSPRQISVSAVLMGIGICGMHYTGMAAMQFDGRLLYQPGMFALSVVIAIVASGAALWMAFTLARHASAYRFLFQLGAAAIMGGAICGMHYTGMAASVFMPDANCRYDPNQNFDSLALSVATASGMILAIALGLGMHRRAQMELSVQSSEARLRTIIENALDAVVAMDQLGSITEWNRQAEVVFGWSRQEALGQNLAEMIIPPADRDAHRRGLAHFLAAGVGPVLNKRIEVSALNRRGELFPAELAITAQRMPDHHHFTAFIRDISERRRNEESRALLAAIVASTDDPILSATLGGIITSWNAAAERLLGYRAAQAIGRHIRLIIPLDRQGEEQDVIAQIANGQSIEHYETVRVAKDGRRIDVSVSISPIRDETGRALGAAKVLRDITMRKLADAELARHVEALERSNKELDDFAYIASHDLKEPLRGLFYNAKFLQDDYAEKLDPEGVRRLLRLGYLSQRMEQLVNDLLYFSRLGRQELAIQSTDLNAVIRDIQLMIETTLEERNATIVIPHELPRILCDKTRVAEVFRNLITNAVKYNDNAIKRVEIGYLEELKTKDGVERQVFYVKDNGIGIAEEFYEAIFRIFKRLNVEDDDKKGTGVGLTFVRKIVERHGGRIWLDSSIGQGTTFYFTIEQGHRYEAVA